MGPGGADRYAELEVLIKKGADPVLIVTSDGDLRIDLETYTSREALDALMLDKGFAVRPNVDTLFNRNASCIPWRDTGECLQNPTFMHANCEFACSMLRDRDSNCAEWARQGECTKNTKFMYGNCPVACKSRDEL